MRLWSRVRTWFGSGRPDVVPGLREPSEPQAGVAACRACQHFRNDPTTLEAALPGLSVLSSSRGAVRADDGLCSRHDRFVSPRSSCRFFHGLSPRRDARPAPAGTSGP